MTKRWSSVRSDLVTTKRAASKAARRVKIDADDIDKTDKIHPAIEAVAREIFNEQFEGVSSYHGDNPVAVTWDSASPTLKVEYLHIAKTLIRAYHDATREPSEDMEVAIHEARDLPVWRIYQIIHDQLRRELGP